MPIHSPPWSFQLSFHKNHPITPLMPSLSFQAFYYPEEAGVAFGGPGSSRHLRLEIHYHNPLIFRGEWGYGDTQRLASETRESWVSARAYQGTGTRAWIHPHARRQGRCSTPLFRGAAMGCLPTSVQGGGGGPELRANSDTKSQQRDSTSLARDGGNLMLF